jgi:ribA/ribD-fused uncharacterized protein
MTDCRDTRSAPQLIAAIQQGARPKYLHFWGHTVRPDGVVTATCLSQWYPAQFVVDGVAYPSAEHFMMAEKARLFGDAAMRERVLAARSPAQAKALGRQVSGFDDAAWNAARFAIVVAANEAKFAQHPRLRVLFAALAGLGGVPLDRLWA